MKQSVRSLSPKLPLRQLRVLILISLLAPVFASTVSEVRAQEALQSPAEFLDYELGERFTPQHRVQAYVEHVAKASPNVQLQRYGESFEGRPLMVAFVASPENLERIEDIRQDNLRAAGLREGGPSLDDPPALVWLSYGVHGNESVSTEAAMQTLYELADPNNQRTQRWLEDAVVVIDPNLNPDGRERYVQWFNRTVGSTGNPAPEAREHDEPWPGGRTNHFYFDLNRDWAWATQGEVRQRLALYNEWMPHVHVDFHEMGVDSPYYFAPAAEPFHSRITDWQRSFQETIGDNHRRYFDEDGRLYYTREVFDLLYPGYGDTWPIFNGAIGMTYEQGGGGRAGLGIVTAEGDTLTLSDRINNHHTTGLSTVEVTARNSDEVVSQFRQYFQQEPEGPYLSYVIKGSNDAGTLRAFTEHLDVQGIEYGRATGNQQASGHHYTDGEDRNFEIEEGDIVVSAYQPKSTLTQVLFDPKPELADSLTYDITAWALPYAYGLQAYALQDRIEPDAAVASFGGEVLEGPEAPYAYLVRWESFENARFLAAVLQEDINLRIASQPFEIDGRRYGEGSLVITRAGNQHMGERFDETVRRLAEEYRQTLHPVATGFVDDGSDFGSNTKMFVERPRIAVVSGEPTSSYSLGEVWHFFDQQLEYPATLINADRLGSIIWSDYDVLVLPSGSYGDVFEGERLDQLRSWIRSGGRLIALDGAVSFLARQEDGFAITQKEDKEAEEEEEEDLTERLRIYAEREREAASRTTPGAIFKLQMDGTHPLGYGFANRPYFVLKQGAAAFEFLEDGWNVGVLREDSHRAGFVGAEAAEQLEDSLILGVEPMGRGQVVYITDTPLFRGFWYNGRLLFSNAVFFVGQ